MSITSRNKADATSSRTAQMDGRACCLGSFAISGEVPKFASHALGLTLTSARAGGAKEQAFAMTARPLLAAAPLMLSAPCSPGAAGRSPPQAGWSPRGR